MQHSLVRMSCVVLAANLAVACVDREAEDAAVTSSTEQASTTGPPGTTQTTLLPRGEVWAYYDRGGLSGTSWRINSGCSPDCFQAATAPLGYGETYLRTTIGYGPDASHKYITSYFRNTFINDTARPVRALYLRVMYDDGFVFYINGKEGGRASMPSGAITSSTLALGHEAENQYVTYDISSQIPNLQGFNWLAFEVHQQAGSSSDLVFDAELIAYVDGAEDITTEEGVPRASGWRFWDRANVPATWKTTTLDETGWSTGPGPLGFGESYLATTVATGQLTNYFRKTFTVAGSVHGITGEVMYDDGFVAYLNGTEIGRAAMPAGTPTGSTLSSGHEANNAYQTFDWSAAVPLLVEGTNTLAIEVHQNAASSSDLVFDLALKLTGAWLPQTSGTTALLNGVYFTDAMHGWAVGAGGTIRRTIDGGAHWTGQAAGTTQDLRAITFADAMHGWIVGAAGTVLATVDGGNTWTAQAGITDGLGDVDFVSATVGWTAGGTAKIYKTTDGGATWTAQPLPTAHPITHVDFVDAMNGWAAAPEDEFEGSVFHTTDGGVTWTVQAPEGAFGFLTDLEAVDPSTVWYVRGQPHDESDERMYVSRDGGTTFTVAPWTTNNMQMAQVEFFDAMHGWAIGAGGSIISSVDGGATWQIQQVRKLRPMSDRPIGEGPHYNAIHMATLTEGWIVGDGGTILHTSTGGF